MEQSSNSDTSKPQQPPLASEPFPHSIMESAGKFADDPFWDEMMDSIRRHRLEMDAAIDAEE